jgi:hypothetical protein
VRLAAGGVDLVSAPVPGARTTIGTDSEVQS